MTYAQITQHERYATWALREHGGSPGIRDENALGAALARAQQKAHSDQ